MIKDVARKSGIPVGCAMLVAMTVLPAFAEWNDQLLTDKTLNLVELDENGDIVILKSSANYYGSCVGTNAFDGAIDTYADINANVAWLGIKLTSPKVITRIRIHGRTNNDGQATRLGGCFIEGANTADFSDAELLYVVVLPSGWKPKTDWIESRVNATAANKTFTYLRIRSGGVNGVSGIHAGNPAELEFYGIDAPAASAVPAVPAASALRINGKVNVDVPVADDAYAYTVSLAVPSGTAGTSQYFNFATAAESPLHFLLPCDVYETATVTVTAGNTAGNTSQTLAPLPSAYPISGAALGGGTATNAFDGDISSPCTLSSEGKVGLDFGVARTVTRIRLVAAGTASLAGGYFEVSGESDFYGAVTVATLDSAPVAGEVTEIILDSPVSGRYMRFVAPRACSIAELEFGAEGPSAEPTAFTVARDDLTNQYAVLSWTHSANVPGTVVYRSYGEAGPWTEVADLAGVSTWKDTTAPLGVPCYYKVAAAVGTGGSRIVGEMSAASVSHRRCQLLERDWSDMTKLKDGVTVIWSTTGTKRWGCGTVGTPTTDEGAAKCAFDGDEGSFPNMGVMPSNARLAVGVDLGEACCIGFIRTMPRNHSQGITNFKGLVFYGSNNGEAWAGTSEPALTEPTTSGVHVWNELSTTNTTPYRYVYASNPSVSTWNNMVAEIQFYGWPATALDGYPVGATELTAVQVGAAVALNWNANGAASIFTVERKAGEGDWLTLASGLAATAYVDATVACDGTAYAYRVVTVKGEAMASSKTTAIIPYEHGGGNGLHAVYRFPYVSTNVGESVVATATNAVAIAAATAEEERALIDGVEGSHTNVFVTWTGKLIVPFDGAYRFYAAADDAVSVYIDDDNVLCNPSVVVRDGEIRSAAVTLTAGEHDILVQYWQGEGASGCTLFWDGAVMKEPIPASQLVPVPPGTLPEPWEGARTFTRDASSLFPGNVRVNPDGSFDFSFCGEDLCTCGGSTKVISRSP